jgi:hypothetical protein
MSTARLRPLTSGTVANRLLEEIEELEVTGLKSSRASPMATGTRSTIII